MPKPTQGYPTPECVRQTRRRLGYSLRSFAKALGYSKAYIVHIESGRMPVTAKFAAHFSATVPKLAKINGPEYLSQKVYRDTRGRFKRRKQ